MILNGSAPQFPIESKFVEHLVNNLNAEISLGTVTNVEEAVLWLSYTYLFVRMRKGPYSYDVRTGWGEWGSPKSRQKEQNQLISVCDKGG